MWNDAKLKSLTDKSIREKQGYLTMTSGNLNNMSSITITIRIIYA